MKSVAKFFIIIGFISLLVGLISRMTLKPVGLIPGTMEANTLLQFTNTCMLIAITLMLWEKSK